MSSALIVDDHPVARQGCRQILTDAGVKKVHEARGAESGYRQYLRHRPDVVIVDLALDGDVLGGLALIDRIRAGNRNARILVLSMHDDPNIIIRALETGAIGYAPKDTSSQDFLTAFEQVSVGIPYLADDVAKRVALSRARPADSLKGVEPRERQILSLLANGKSYADIAKNLGVSYKTVVNDCAQLKKKLSAENLTDLVRIAVRVRATMAPSHKG